MWCVTGKLETNKTSVREASWEAVDNDSFEPAVGGWGVGLRDEGRKMSRNSITEFQAVRGSCHQEFLWMNVRMWVWGCWEPVGRARTTKATQEADLALTRPTPTTAASHPCLRSDFSPPTTSLWSPRYFCQGHQRPPSHSFSAHLTPLQPPSLRCFVSLATTSPTFFASLLFPWLLFLLVCKFPFLSLEFILSLLLLFWATPRGPK